VGRSHSRQFAAGGHIPPVEQRQRSVKQVYVATHVFGQKPTWFANGAESFAGCPVSECRMDYADGVDENTLRNSAALVFHSRDIFSQAAAPNHGLPTFPRRAEQPWIYFNLEPPDNRNFVR
jgi:hypothetical protein